MFSPGPSENCFASTRIRERSYIWYRPPSVVPSEWIVAVWYNRALEIHVSGNRVNQDLAALAPAALTLTMILPFALPDSINRCASRISSNENTAAGFAL